MAEVLIVEDERALAEAYQTILAKHGYSVTLAANGEEALQHMAKQQFNVVLLDMKMPKMNGLEFLRRLEKQGTPEPAIVVFSNQDDQADIEEAFRLGARRYILKAWASPQDLIKVVEEALES